MATLRRYTRPRIEEARCELCRVSLGEPHRHLLELDARKILCACDACALRFEGVIGGRFKLVPREIRQLSEIQWSDAEWDSLALPIHLAFIFFSTPAQKTTALYPSPAGATESLLPLEAWASLVGKNPCLGEIAPDVEAFLMNRVGEYRDYFIVPIDSCFELAGLIRLHWEGLSGGEAVWAQIRNFFDRLKAGAVHVSDISSNGGAACRT